MLDQGNENIIGRIDGLILLAFFLIFLRYTFAIARNGGEEVGEEQKRLKRCLYGNLFFL